MFSTKNNHAFLMLSLLSSPPTQPEQVQACSLTYPFSFWGRYEITDRSKKKKREKKEMLMQSRTEKRNTLLQNNFWNMPKMTNDVRASKDPFFLKLVSCFIFQVTSTCVTFPSFHIISSPSHCNDIT